MITDVLASNSGLFMKVFAKKGSEAYLINMLMDRRKILCVEASMIGGGTLTGEKALNKFRELMDSPMIVDIYPLDEVGVKLSIAENIDVYNESPKVPIDEIFKGVSVSGPEPERPERRASAEVVKTRKAVETRPARPKEQVKPKTAEKKQGAPEIIVEVSGGSIPEKAFKEYSKALLEDARKIRSFNVQRIEFRGELSGGVLYLNVYVYGTSEGSMREIAEKRMLHSIGKYAPIILREADVKPVLRELKVIINGKEIKPEEIQVKEKRKSGKIDKEGRINLTVLDEVWPYFSAMIRTAVSEIEREGILVKRANFDVLGRRELEINASFVVETRHPKETVEDAIRRILGKHARELSRTIKRYINVHKIDVDVIRTHDSLTVPVRKVSGKAAEVLSKKEELEKEVEKLLKQAGIDELQFLAEEKKKESESVIIRNRVEPAMEDLKTRLHKELKLVPRADFKWLKMKWDVKDTTVYVELEASFAKEEVGGLFGTLSGVSDEKIKNDATETILYIMKDVAREHGITIKPKKINVIVK